MNVDIMNLYLFLKIAFSLIIQKDTSELLLYLFEELILH